jgi:hypothetical protein
LIFRIFAQHAHIFSRKLAKLPGFDNASQELLGDLAKVELSRLGVHIGEYGFLPSCHKVSATNFYGRVLDPPGVPTELAQIVLVHASVGKVVVIFKLL